jgi:hypothetical protein
MEQPFSAADLFRGHAFLWMTRWGFYCLCLDQFCPIRLVLCVDDSRTNDFIERQTGLRVFALDRTTGYRTEGRDGAMDSILPSAREEVQPILAHVSSGQWSAVSTNPSRSLAAFAAEAGIEYVGPPPDLCHWLNDKANFLAGLEQIGLPRLRGRWLRLNEARYAELAAEFGRRFVAQLPRGTSGSGTWFVGSEDDQLLAGERCGDALAWVAPDLGDLSLNVNAIATEEGTAVAYPSVQLVGLPALCTRRGQYCGNDYAATASLPRETVHLVVQQTERIGQWLTSLGFRGLFGLDFVVDPATCEIFAVDLNPRWQGSTLVLAQAQQRTGGLSLPVAELAYRKGLLGAREVLEHRESFLAPVQAAHISLRNRASGCVEVTGALDPGVYSFEDAPSYLRPGLRLEDLRDSQEMLVIGAVPRRGARMSAGAHILRACSQRQVLDPGRMELLRWSETAARLLYQALVLRPE